MVVYQDNKPYFGIVDGQQRLTTITLILSAIRDAFIKLGEQDLARGVHQYVEQPNIDNINEFVLHSETSFPYLQNHIQSYAEQKIDLDVGTEETKLKNAYEIISRNLEKYAGCGLLQSPQLELVPTDSSPITKLKILRDKVLSLKLVFIQLDNEDDAYLIFETLNARGRDLKSSDLVKNLLLKTIKNTNVNIDTPKEAWVNLVNKFDDIGEIDAVDNFILHYWISKHSYCSEKELFSKVKEYVQCKDTAQILLADFNFYGLLYCKMLNPDFFTWDNNRGNKVVKTTLLTLNRFKVKQQSSFVLALLASFENKIITLNNLQNALQKIEHFHFIFNAITSQRSSGHIVTTYSKNAVLLSNAKDANVANKIIKDLLEALSRKLPHYDEFEVKFMELMFTKSRSKDRNVIKYCLSRLMPNTSACLDINYDSLTIEHLISQSDSNRDIEEIGSIGNLLLVDQVTNSEVLKNKVITEKLIHLKAENYPLEQSFIPENFFGSPEDIEQRAKNIARYLFQKSKV